LYGEENQLSARPHWSGRSLSLLTVGLTLMLFWNWSCTSAPRYTYTHPKSGATTKDKDVTLLLKNTNRATILTASFYGKDFHGKKTSNGEVFDMYGLSAAHKSLPFGTVLHVTYPPTGKSVTVTINDRGPFIYGRDLDLSYGAANKIGLVNDGVGKVKVRVLKWGDGSRKN
jgi:rare lipoprotein A